MYRRPKFLEILLEIRQKMSREADYDADLFAEMVRNGSFTKDEISFGLNENQNADDQSQITTRKPKI